MKRLLHILPLILLGFVSCRDFHVTLVGDAILAQVDSKILLQSEIANVIPKEYHGEDSVAFVEVFIDKWIRKQVKLREAERLFLASETNIEAMVEEYRQLLLIKRLDEFYVNASIDETYSDSQIVEYYQKNSSNFRLSREIVKGEVLRVPIGHDQSKKIKELMGSSSQASRSDFVAICDKNDFEFTDLSLSWVDAVEILDHLPLTRGDDFDKLLSKRGVNHMKDSNYDYYYQIFDHIAVGDVAPLEWVASTIRTILITEHQQELIRANEQSLYGKALLEGAIKRQYQERTKQE